MQFLAESNLKGKLMKKIIAIVTILLFVGGGFWWQQSQNYISGMKRETISAHEMARKWRKNSDDTLLEVQDDKLYMQESIGSQGVGLTRIQPLAKDFVLRFEVMSQTKHTSLQIKAFEKYDDEVYDFNIQTANIHEAPAIVKNEQILAPKGGNVIEPKKFYLFEISIHRGKLVMRIDGKKVAEAIEKHPLHEGQLVINIQGSIDNPAGIFIRNVELFETNSGVPQQLP